MRHHRSAVLPRAPASCRRSRELLGAALEAAGQRQDACTAIAELLVSELATNAVRYGGGPEFEVLVDAGPDDVRVVVRDASTEVPRPRDAAPLDQGGRGMRLVQRMSTAWGWDVGGQGKAVWFVLECGDVDARSSPGGGVDHDERQAPPDLPVDGQDQRVSADAGHGGEDGDGEADGEAPALGGRG